MTISPSPMDTNVEYVTHVERVYEVHFCLAVLGGMMAGTLALVGSGEFLERMRGVDAQLLVRVGGQP